MELPQQVRSPMEFGNEGPAIDHRLLRYLALLKMLEI
jgi:hypothetical protein